MAAPPISPPEPAVYLRSLTLHGFRAFADGTCIDFTRDDGRPAQWTILLGENGTGKTAALQAIAAMMPVCDGGDWRPRCTEGPGWFAWWDFNRAIGQPARAKLDLALCSAKCGLGDATNHSHFSWFAEAEFQLSETGHLSGHLRSKEQSIPEFHIIGYGLGRSAKSALTASREAPLETLLSRLDDLPSPESWLLELHHASVLDGDEAEKAAARRTYESVTRCVQAVLPDIEAVRIRRTERRVYADPAVRAEFLTPYGWVLFEQLGVGYQSIASWTVDLLRRLHDLYGRLERPETGPAVVLVDEFDLHLHPKWQLTLMDHLGKIFTNTQFIITAHSPLVVQGAGRDTNLVVLQRQTTDDGEIRIVADNDPVRVHGWRLDQIVTSDLYGLASARSPEYAALFQQRSKLAAKTERSAQEEKQLRDLTRRIEAEAPPSIDADLAALAAKLQAAQKP